MKTTLTKATLLLMLLATMPVRSFATSNDTIINYAYLNGEIKILSGNGELYRLAKGKDGYKYVYYLFTAYDYLHLDSTDVTADNSHYCLFGENQNQAVWYNSETKDTANRTNVIWPLKYKGKNDDDKECIQGNPHRCLKRKLDDPPIQLLINADGNYQKKVDTSTLLLTIMPPFKDRANPKEYLTDSKLNYGSFEGRSIKDFYDDVILTKKDTLLTNVRYVFIRSDRAIIDSIMANGILIPIEDNLLGGPKVVANLDNIPIEQGKDVDIKVYYRYLNGNGEIKSLTDTKTLRLHWKKNNAPWWVVILVIIAILFFIRLLVYLVEHVMNKRKEPKSKGGKAKTTPKTQATSLIGNGGIQPKSKESLFERLFKHKNQPQQTLNGQAPRTIKRLEKELQAKDTEIAALNKDLTDIQEELERAKAALSTAENDIEKAYIKGIKEVEQTMEAFKTECDRQVTAAQDAQHEAERKAQERIEKAEKEAKERIEKAEENANAKFQEDKETLERECQEKLNAFEKECQEKVKAAEATVKKAENDATAAKTESQKAIAAMKEQCDAQLKRWENDRAAILGKLQANVEHLEATAEKMNPEAFNKNCKTIQKGIHTYAETLKKHINSEVWKTLTTGECLAALRAECCSILNAGSGSWISLLGRLYSYMSVNELRLQLLTEDLSFELVSDAFVTTQAILASLGIVVLNCSPGFDSSEDPVTASLFAQDTTIDRITSWLDGDAALRKAIPNKGHTVYDFGQLAYFTSEDLEIHQGSVIYYNS